jgi:hypothetical protein
LAVEETEQTKEESVVSEPITAPTDSKSEEFEDLEYLKAGEDIVRLKAEVMKAATGDDDV